MILKIFLWAYTAIIGRVPEAKRAKAEDKFKEFMAILVEAGVKGAVKGMKG